MWLWWIYVSCPPKVRVAYISVCNFLWPINPGYDELQLCDLQCCVLVGMFSPFYPCQCVFQQFTIPWAHHQPPYTLSPMCLINFSLHNSVVFGHSWTLFIIISCVMHLIINFNLQETQVRVYHSDKMMWWVIVSAYAKRE